MLRLSLFSVAVASVAAGVSAVIFAAAMPLNIAAITESGSKPASIVISRGPSALPPLFADVALVDLRRGWTETPPTPVTSPEPVTVQNTASVLPSIRLLGTVIEAGHTMALFSDANGKCQFKSVGDQVEGATILEIHDSVATLLWNDSRVDVAIPRDTALAASNASPMTASSVSVTPATTGQVSLPSANVNPVANNRTETVPEISTDEKEMCAFLNRKPTLEDN